MKIKENKTSKHIRSKYYNYNFDKTTGYFERWGQTKEDDPIYSPLGPEILDLEISTSVRPEHEKNYNKNRLVYDGGCIGNCAFCYKSNGHYPTYNMTFEEFKIIFHKMPKNLMQIAFGILNIKSNPDFFKMARYARENGVIPNFTMHGLDNITDEDAKEIKEIFGACAISVYNKEASYNTIKKLTDAGMDQVNIHYVISEESYNKTFEIIDDMGKDDRLSEMNAIVFLSLKTKGGGENFHQLSTEKYNKLVEYAMEKKIKFGFDSCGAHKFLDAVKGHTDYKKFEMMAEPCEQSCFSSYLNVKGEYFGCSFYEGTKDWEDGISVINCDNFIKDVWTSDRVVGLRNKLLNNNRHCPIYKI